HPRPWRGPGTRRFRQRPLLARLPAALPVRHHQDRPVLRGTNGKGARPVVLRSIISLAHDLGMEVVAEGAGTDSDAVELSQLGCEYAQGYYFGEPMSADDAKALLQDEGVSEESDAAPRKRIVQS